MFYTTRRTHVENTTTVIDINATDDDDSEGSGLTYSLSGGVDAGLFSIDAATGEVTFNSAPDFEAPGDANGDNNFEFQVTVTDSGGLTDLQDITVSVTDVVENTAPHYYQCGYCQCARKSDQCYRCRQY